MNGRLGGCGVIAEKKAVLKRRHKVALAPLPANKSGQECVGIYTKKNEEAENGKIFAKAFWDVSQFRRMRRFLRTKSLGRWTSVEFSVSDVTGSLGNCSGICSTGRIGMGTVGICRFLSGV